MKISFGKIPPAYRKQIFLAAAAFLGLVIVFLISSNFYPILMVNGSPVSARRFSKNYRAALWYQNKLLDTYAPARSQVEPVSGRELEAMVLSQLVEAELISAGVRREVGNDLEYLVSGKIQKYDDNRDLKNAAMTLYGMSYADFRREILIPQAKRDILAGRLYLRGEDIGDWLAREKQTARVIVFSKKFHWDGRQIVAN
jgi:hypothetical protein